jgi:pimeloyl-ACP methyl ester carboxylesterase
MGGEGAILPSTGIFYPWVGVDLAERFRALIVEPEHRFYGTSNPAGPAPFTGDSLRLLTPQQALADAAKLIVAKRSEFNCTAPGTAGYCPVITVGGSYPGFLSAMMRLRYPAVVDMAYSASAPTLLYAQQIDPTAYYQKVTESAERSVPGCPTAVRQAFTAYLALKSTKETLLLAARGHDTVIGTSAS